MSVYRKFSISCEYFSGFTKNINIEEFDSLDEIIVSVVSSLESILIESNLEMLVKKLRTLNFHVHDYNFLDVLTSADNRVFYICSHC